MGQRGRPRDLYDIVNLFRRSDLRQHATLVREVLVEKCRTKSVEVPTFASVAAALHRAELESEWANMLGHQLPALPPLKQFLDELPDLFAWLHGEAEYPALAAISRGAGEDLAWTPPPTAATWRQGVPLEPVRFAATNRLCVALTYNGTVRLIEPYALRRTNDGYLVLHALRVDNRQHRSYRVDRIQRVEVTTRPFRPVYAVEFSSSGLMTAPPARRSAGYAAPRPSLGAANITGRSTSCSAPTARSSSAGRRATWRYGRTRHRRATTAQADSATTSGKTVEAYHSHLPAFFQ